jgi:hypothetical protein
VPVGPVDDCRIAVSVGSAFAFGTVLDRGAAGGFA